MATLNLTDDEKKLLLLAIRQALTAAARSEAKAALPLVQDAYKKQKEVLNVVYAKVENMK